MPKDILSHGAGCSNGHSTLKETWENYIQYNLNGSNPDGSFTVDDSNSFLTPYEILPIAQENKYLRKFSIIVELCVVCTH